MKKTKLIIGVALVCALAFACLAFTACGSPLGDGTFNINTTKEATDAEFKAFNENVAAANKATEDGMPAQLADKSFKVATNFAYSLNMEGMKSDSSFSLEGVVNMSDAPTAKLKGDIKSTISGAGTSTESKGTMELTAVSNTIYLLSKTDTATTKSKMSMDDILDMLPIGGAGVYAAADATADETEQSVAEFLQGIKDVFAMLNMDVSPKLYIDGGVMKVQLNDENYIGVAYDDEWHLKGTDVVIKGVDLDLSKFAGPSAAGFNIKIDIELAMRTTGAETVTAPSDASDYADMAGMAGLPF